ncbi:UPF0104 family protein [Jejubacter calystegiae]|uniref:UPF0104 family protein n=1 Tax=Jejubacter calystegiae TaxID=2579935 RepID=A0A4P8YKY2_9ENTR|nr:YbhN family protein [Jejubacter calystegiae]QCT20646.1 UPF0104 family protein [Jejubacter calystegiae]
MAATHPHWRRVTRLLNWLFVLGVLTLIVFWARQVDWPEVWRAFLQLPPSTLLFAAGLAAFSYLLYGGYDLLARAWCGHSLGAGKVISIAAICYAFNLTLSTWVGGIAMRYRLYSRPGLSGSTIAAIFSLSLTTNWLGYLLLGGLLFSLGAVPLPAHWYITPRTLQLLGALLLALVTGWLWCCARLKRRRFTLRGLTLALPDGKFALAQLLLSSANWMTMAAIIWVLMGDRPAYLLVLGVLLVSSIAGVIVHIPAGIGVLEGVFIALLAGSHVNQGTLLAALLTWRLLYFFIPLLLATLGYLWMEGRARPESPAR